ncbi:DUF2335 domain-containing protein [Vibrio sp. Vb0304]|uniref:DUF2335 domain-containing protein n=1 Tax=Vibrio sp. Vb0304 TaxID=3074623 RepID=UPI0029651B85|nr:DUF2335 domain-containing protein [Vibrio sp. Vb0304]MDW1979894.1 DUF2335 domain-containing protein [Vibrio sp. Vb0304]
MTNTKSDITPEPENKNSGSDSTQSSELPPNPLDVLVEEEPGVGEVIKKTPEVERILREHPEVAGALLQVTTQTHFSGPLPPPDIMKGYEDICPGAARDILDMAKNDAEHIRQMQKGALRGNTIETVLGIISGLIISLSAIGAITYAAVSGQPVTAGVVGSVAVLAGVFMRKKVTRPKVSKIEENDSSQETK